MIPKDHCASVVFTDADVKLLCIVVYADSTLSRRRLRLIKAQIFELTPLVKERVMQDIWRTYFPGSELTCSIEGLQHMMDWQMIQDSRKFF